MRGGLGGAAGEVSGFPFELEGEPEEAVVADFEEDFGALAGHALEEAVGVEGAEGRDRVVEGVERGWQESLEAGDASVEKGVGRSEGEEKGGKGEREGGPFTGLPPERGGRVRDGAGEEEAAQAERPAGIIEQREAKNEGEEVEVGVIAGEENGSHEEGEAEGGDTAAPASGEDGEGEDQLHDVHENAAGLVKGGGEMVGEPGKSVGQGLGFVVVEEGGEITPSGVSTSPFDEAGEEHEAEKEPMKEQDGGAGWRAQGLEGREGAPGGEQSGEESGLQEEGVPLEAHEDVSGDDEGEIDEPEREEQGALGETRDDECGEDHAETDDELDEAVMRLPMKDGGNPPKEGGLIPVFDGLDVFHHLSERQDAFGTDEAAPLDGPGD